MRYESAMKVIGCLRASLGEPLSISAICSRIALSYQPTYRHVRELEAAGVLTTERAGREVLCRLADSHTAALWLALASAGDGEQTRPGGPDRLAAQLGEAARAGRLGEILGLAVIPGEDGRQVLALAPTGGDTQAIRARITNLCAANGVADADPLVLDREQFARRLLQEWTPVGFADRAHILAGHQALWEAVLAAAPVRPALPAANRAPLPARPRRAPRASQRQRDAEVTLRATDSDEGDVEEDFID
jgi:DNA-binding transcriptional ArsR family regulator